MEAGFDVDVATLSGYPVKLELWAMPTEDEAVISTYNKLKEKLKQPKKLADVIKNELGPIQTIYLSLSQADMLQLLVFLKVRTFNKH